MGKRGPKPGTGGRPRKPLAEKIIEGNPGKRELTKLQIPSQGEKAQSKSKSKPMAGLPSYLDMVAKEGGDALPSVGGIYTILTDWIEGAGCGNLVSPNLIEDFAFLRRGYLECEYMNRKLGRIASGKRSPYVNMAIDYHKQMMVVYNQIWVIVSRNCEEKVEGKNAFLELLANRGF